MENVLSNFSTLEELNFAIAELGVLGKLLKPKAPSRDKTTLPFLVICSEAKLLTVTSEH